MKINGLRSRSCQHAGLASLLNCAVIWSIATADGCDIEEMGLVGDFRESNVGLGEAVHAWEYFVAECERGYQFSIYEFDNEMSCRDVIEEMLYSPERGDEELYRKFHERVEAADKRFRALALEGTYRQSDGVAWWHRVVVDRAGAELASDLCSRYGVSVDVVGPNKLP